MTRRSRHLLGPVVTALALALGSGGASGQTPLRISGQIDLTAATPDDLGVNTAFRGDNPFNPVRLRMYAQKWVTDRIGIFTEFFYDTGADIRINGAYAVVNTIGGLDWLNARLGIAPSVVGSFGLRSTYFNANPLIGVPLAWMYRTNLSGSGTNTAASLTGAAATPGPGMPLLYDSCWNIQWELLGELGIFEYSLALSPGSLSSPVRSRDVEGQTFMARVGATVTPGLRLGISAAEGPYLSPPVAEESGDPPYPGDPQDYMQQYLGLDLEFLGGPWAIYAEAHAGLWEAPLVDEDLEAASAFVEVRYDVAPAWYLAGRVGGMGFNEIDAGPEAGGVAPWDHDVVRTEFAVGYRLAREVLLKVDWQRTSAGSDRWTQNILAAQLSAVF